jgi:hypothetical protein
MSDGTLTLPGFIFMRINFGMAILLRANLTPFCVYFIPHLHELGFRESVRNRVAELGGEEFF